MPEIFGASLVCDPEKDLLAKYLPENGLLLEIGTWAGATCAYILDNRPAATALCVDNYEGGIGNGVPTPEDLWLFVKNARERPGRMNLFLGNSSSLGRFLIPVFDLVFVDGDHSEAGAYRDLCIAASMCIQGGHIAAHDILQNDAGPSEPKKALDLFLAKKPWRIVEQNNVTAILERT